MVCDRVEQLVHIPAEAVTLGGLLVIPAMAQGMVLFAHGSGSSRHSPRFNIDLLAIRLVAATPCLYTQSRAHDLTLTFFAVVFFLPAVFFLTIFLAARRAPTFFEERPTSPTAARSRAGVTLNFFDQ